MQRMGRLVEVSTGRVVAARVQRADTFARRLLGLLGRPGLPVDGGLWIEPCGSVHTFFMRFPIDVVVLDSSGVILRCVSPLAPWRAMRPVRRGRVCVELPAGAVKAAGLVDGLRLRWEPG